MSFNPAQPSSYNPPWTHFDIHECDLDILSVSFESYRFVYLIELSCNFEEIEQILFRVKSDVNSFVNNEKWFIYFFIHMFMHIHARMKRNMGG